MSDMSEEFIAVCLRGGIRVVMETVIKNGDIYFNINLATAYVGNYISVNSYKTFCDIIRS